MGMRMELMVGTFIGLHYYGDYGDEDGADGWNVHRVTCLLHFTWNVHRVTWNVHRVTFYMPR